LLVYFYVSDTCSKIHGSASFELKEEEMEEEHEELEEEEKVAGE
jgi:hypothetical protein